MFYYSDKEHIVSIMLPFFETQKSVQLYTTEYNKFKNIYDQWHELIYYFTERKSVFLGIYLNKNTLFHQNM